MDRSFRLDLFSKKFQFSTFAGISFVSASKDSSQISRHVLLTATEAGASLQQLLQQREEENRVEIERLTAEIKALKLQLLQYTNGKLKSYPLLWFSL